jgi:hypothetical protein
MYRYAGMCSCSTAVEEPKIHQIPQIQGDNRLKRPSSSVLNHRSYITTSTFRPTNPTKIVIRCPSPFFPFVLQSSGRCGDGTYCTSRYTEIFSCYTLLFFPNGRTGGQSQEISLLLTRPGHETEEKTISVHMNKALNGLQFVGIGMYGI